MYRRVSSAVFVWILSLVLVAATGPPAQAADEWRTMASQDVILRAGSATVDVSRAPGRTKVIRVRAKSGALTVTRIVVTYDAGQPRTDERTTTLRAGETTAAIAAGDGAEHFVDTVVLTFAEADANGPSIATVEIQGLQSPEGAKARRPAPAEVATDASGTRGVGKGNTEAKPPGQNRRAVPAPPVVATAPPPPPASAPVPPGSGTRGVGIPPPLPSSPNAPISPAAKPSDKAAADKTYATVPVMFGTDRKPGENRKPTIATFGVDSQFKLALGQALITVPINNRERGSVPRPELNVFGVRIPWGTEQLDRHFTVYSAGPLDEATFLARVKDSLAKSRSFDKHALLFVHGFNMNFEDSLYRTAQMAHDLEFDGVAFTYSWPSQGSADPRAYLADEDRAKGARPYLREFLELIAAKTDVQHLHIVAHSKGADLLVEVLSTLGATADARKRLRINEIILAAPDIDRANFEQIAERIVAVAQRGVTLYASNNDKALGLSKAARRGSVRAGEVPAASGPVMVRGIDTIDISAASTGYFGDNHTTFAERLVLITDMGAILRTGKHPPDERSGSIFKPVPLGQGKYWKYVQ